MIRQRHILALALFFLLASSPVAALAQEEIAPPETATEEAITEATTPAIMDVEEEDDDFDDLDDEFEEDYQQSNLSDQSDPLEGYNRFMTEVNDIVYVYALVPVSKGWNYILPSEVQSGINHLFKNLFAPMNSLNNLFQGKIKNSGTELARFGINSTLGIGGIFDPSEAWFGIEEKQEDFGQTLGAWGVGSGFHIVLPILGPSNARDSIGLVSDYFVDPVYFIENPWAALGTKTTKLVNEKSLKPEEYESLKSDALDLYPFLRDIYEQNQDQKIKE